MMSHEQAENVEASEEPTVEVPTTEQEDVSAEEPLYIGVVAGGYEESIPTDSFKVVVNPQAEARIKKEVGRWGIVKADTDMMTRDGRTFRQTTYGVIDDVKILPGYAFRDAKEMAQSTYYRDKQFSTTFSSVAEDALELSVKSLGHEKRRGDLLDLFGPIRPPERESKVFLAVPNEVRAILMKPHDTSHGIVRTGAYATLHGLYPVVTHIALPKEQIFLHGSIYATTGWGKTVLIKHLIQEFLGLDEPPAIVVFNVKGYDFYDLEKPLPDTEWGKMLQWNPDVDKVWQNFKYRRCGIEPERTSYYPIGPASRRGYEPYSIKFDEIAPDEDGAAFFRLLFEDAGLSEAAMNYLIEYLFFFKRHFTRFAGEPGSPHPSANLGQPVLTSCAPGEIPNIRLRDDTLENFALVLRTAIARNRQGQWINLRCSVCQAEQRVTEGVDLQPYAAQAISRALSEALRLNIFDFGSSIEVPRIVTGGHVSVIDVVGLRSPRGAELFIRHLLHSIFNHINRENYDREAYRGLIILLDEAWRFFRSKMILEEVDTISRMGRSLRIGLWLADQTIPSLGAQQAIMSNIHTRVFGSFTGEAREIKSVMPLDERSVVALNNLPRGMGVFYNIELSRMPTPFIVPPCRCYHEG